jgi:elongation factor G
MVKKSEDIRNIALAGHGGSGKTTLTEGLLYLCGHTSRLGRVDDGNTISDYEPEEQKRKVSINLSLNPCFYENKKINILDAPGYADFFGEVISALTAADSLILVIDGVSGAQVQTEKIFNAAYELPRAFFINKLEKEHADFESALNSCKELLEVEPLPLTIPFGRESNFKGVIDVVSSKAFIYEGGKGKETSLPDEIKSEVEKYREKAIEAAAEGDDELLEKYLEEGDLSEDEIFSGLKKSFISEKIFPLFCGSAYNLIGLDIFLSYINRIFPSPAERNFKVIKEDKEENLTISSEGSLLALIFKTMTDPYVGRLNYVKVFQGILKSDSQVYNVNQGKKERVGHIFMLRGKEQEDVKEVIAGDIATIPKLSETKTGDTLSEGENLIIPPPKFPEPVFSVAIEPKSKGDEEKLSTCLSKLAEEDNTLKVFRNHETKETVVSGLGDLHLEVLLDRLKRKFKVEAELREPKISYKETIKKKSKAQGKYKRQSGGRGQYGDVWLEIEPLPRGSGFEFVDKIVGGVVPKNYIPSVEKGIKEAMEGGVLAGYPVIDVKVTLYDGSHHPVDSSDMAFKIAGSLGFKNAAKDANLVLLEPIMNLEVMVPEKYMGDVIGDISSKRGRVLGMDSRGKLQVIKAQVPLAELSKYATELRSLTHGEGSFSMEFSHYDEVPREIAQKIIDESKKKEAS